MTSIDPLPVPQTSDIASELPIPDLQPPTPFAHRGNGKVARLPKHLRDQINQGLLDGLPYADIIRRLGQPGQDLNPSHLGEWRKRGYQDWLLAQAWLGQIRARQEPAAELATDTDATQLNHAALQLGALHIFEAFRDLTPQPPEPQPESPGDGTEGVPDSEPRRTDATGAESIPQNQHSKLKNQKSSRSRSSLDLRLGGDSAAFVRLLNALARASRETMLIQKYREACAQARAALRELKDPKRKLTDDERRAIVLQVDEILGIPTDNSEIPPPSSSPTDSPQITTAPKLHPSHARPLENLLYTDSPA